MMVPFTPDRQLRNRIAIGAHKTVDARRGRETAEKGYTQRASAVGRCPAERTREWERKHVYREREHMCRERGGGNRETETERQRQRHTERERGRDCARVCSRQKGHPRQYPGPNVTNSTYESFLSSNPSTRRSESITDPRSQNCSMNRNRCWSYL